MADRRRFAGHVLGYLAIGCGLLQLPGCGGDASLADSAVGSNEAPIIAGVPANGALLNAIGSLGNVYVDPKTQAEFFAPFCSASLIGKQTIVTAKHCIQFFASDYAAGYRTAFAVGPDASAPSRLIEVVGVAGAPGDVGGFTGFGRDVGVMYLGEKVTDLTPLTLGTLRPADLGKEFVEIGYGMRDNTGAYGTRRAGTAHLVATTGKVFEIFFGSFEAFKSWYFTGSPSANAVQFSTGPVGPLAFLPMARSLPNLQSSPVPASPVGAGGEGGASDPGTGGKAGSGSGGSPGEAGSAGEGEGGAAGGGGGSDPWDPDAYLQYIYDTTLLMDGYEAMFGGKPGDAQACYGDSGSPIIKANAKGTLIAYGVISGGLGSNSLICDYGGVDAVFGPEVKTFLDTAKKWVDPCNGLSVAGECRGKVATRCTSPLEGPRRLVKFNCASLGQVCAIQPDQTAGCSDPPPK